MVTCTVRQRTMIRPTFYVIDIGFYTRFQYFSFGIFQFFCDSLRFSTFTYRICTGGNRTLGVGSFSIASHRPLDGRIIRFGSEKFSSEKDEETRLQFLKKFYAVLLFCCRVNIIFISFDMKRIAITNRITRVSLYTLHNVEYYLLMSHSQPIINGRNGTKQVQERLGAQVFPYTQACIERKAWVGRVPLKFYHDLASTQTQNIIIY